MIKDIITDPIFKAFLIENIKYATKKIIEILEKEKKKQN